MCPMRNTLMKESEENNMMLENDIGCYCNVFWLYDNLRRTMLRINNHNKRVLRQH